MSPEPIATDSPESTRASAIHRFATGAALMDGHKPTEVEGLIEGLVTALGKSAPAKPHPAVYVSTGLSLTLLVAIITMAFNYGALTNRVAVLESKTQGIEVVGSKLDALQQQFQRFVERYERAEDQRSARSK